jgi:hypothetical protein
MEPPRQVSLTFDSVPTAKLDEVKPKLLRVLRDLASGAVDVDMEHMATVLNRRRLEVLSQVHARVCASHSVCESQRANREASYWAP